MNNFKYSNTNFINLIIVSIIPLLIWGPFFPDLIVSISTLFIYTMFLKIGNFISLITNH